MGRFLCVHGHFYQPPRENPWSEGIEAQESAHPYHDWNARITAECYAPNAAARLFDGRGRIASIVNNYARMSFNFGPTLLAWLQAEAPAVYGAVLAADRASRERFSGHGGAMAQGYNHVIMPLANRRDKETQIVWGQRDFAQRFGRQAAGMWLPETAVDLESLDLMAAHGVRFTILEPHQARRVRALSPGSQTMPALSLAAHPAAGARGSAGSSGSFGSTGALGAAGSSGSDHAERGAPRGRHWRDVSDGSIDSTRPYLVKLPSGRRIALFFYDGPIARAVAFERLLESGEGFAGRLLAAAPAEGHDRLVHVATDGETYGHHHRYGEMALAYALRQIEEGGAATLTNYGEYLAAHPPVDQVEIVENSSWSCVHGVDRWREDCGCRIGGEAGWNQAWRAPLRQALDELRDEIAPLWEAAAGEIFAAPWQARDDYVTVLLDRSPAAVEAFLESHAAGAVPSGARRVRALALLEMQRHAMLMYTSCGWFFDDLGGLEAVQVLRYAARAAQLADELFGSHAERGLVRRLAWARSNDPRVGSGRDLYEARVLPSRVTAAQVAAHYAVRSLFGDLPNPVRLQGHEVARESHVVRAAAGDLPGAPAIEDRPAALPGVATSVDQPGDGQGAAIRTDGPAGACFAAGRLRIESLATGAAEAFCYAGLRYGGPQVAAGVRPLVTMEAGDRISGWESGDSAGEPIVRMAARDRSAALQEGDLTGALRPGAAAAALDLGVGDRAAIPGLAARTGISDDGCLMTEADFASAVSEIAAAFGEEDLARVVRLLDRHLCGAVHGLAALPDDERRRVVGEMEAAAAADVESVLRAVLRREAPLRRLAESAGVTQSVELRAAVEVVLNADLRQALGDGERDLRQLADLLEGAARRGIRLDPGLGAVLAGTLATLLERLLARPDDLALLGHAAARAVIARTAPFAVDLWQAQNLCHELREAAYAPRRAAAAAAGLGAGAAAGLAGGFAAGPCDAVGAPAAGTRWLDLFERLAEALSIGLP
jgi:alpha-amylase/alpha-mannosidase (GH57 family)